MQHIFGRVAVAAEAATAAAAAAAFVVVRLLLRSINALNFHDQGRRTKRKENATDDVVERRGGVGVSLSFAPS